MPTDKGYRFFVDSIARPGPLDSVRSQQVRTFFAHAHGALEQMLSDTSQLLTRLTDHAAVVVGAPFEQATIRSVQLVGLSSRVVPAVTVLSNGSIERRRSSSAPSSPTTRSPPCRHTWPGPWLVIRRARHAVATPTGDPAIDALV